MREQKPKPKNPVITFKSRTLDVEKTAWELIQSSENGKILLEALVELNSRVDVNNSNNNYLLQGKRMAYAELLRWAEEGQKKENEA